MIRKVPLARRRQARPAPSEQARHLRDGRCAAHIRRMITREQWRAFIDHPCGRMDDIRRRRRADDRCRLRSARFPARAASSSSPLGLAMVLKTSMWAKRRYVRFKRWQPKVGRWADWGLRRRSAKRREAMRKERKEIGCPPPEDEMTEGPMPRPFRPPVTRRKCRATPGRSLTLRPLRLSAPPTTAAYRRPFFIRYLRHER